MPISIDSETGNIFAGGDGSDGDLVLRANEGQDRIRLDAGGGNAWLGGNGADGDLVLFRAGGNNESLDQASIHLDGDGGNIFAGGQGADGDLVLRATDGRDRIRLDAGGGNAWLGGNGADGDLVLFAASGDNQTLSQATIHLNGDTGDIILRNADCAEEFTVANSVDADPGMVMVLGEEGLIRPCERAFDTRALGVVSGAGQYRPGIVLDRQEGEADRRPIAVVGKVCVLVNDRNGPIQVGDLLTTSDLPGHAMKAGTPEQSFGAVIGKALAHHDRGVGLIPMIIALQ